LIVDVFNHFYPQEYLDALPRPLPSAVTWVSSTMRGINDVQYRIGQMDKLGIDVQILSLPVPTLDDLDVPVQSFKKITRAANDGISKLAERSQGRFRGIATVSLLNVEEAVEEVTRSVKDLGLLGVQVLSNVRGKPLDSPELEPFYDRVSKLGCGIWIHPAYMRKIYDWMNDDYNLNMMMGWGIDTSLAMFRIFRGGVLERHPDLILIPHHMGTLIPLMAGRINGFVMGQGKNGAPPAPLRKSPMEYMKMFYVDTAEGMWRPALVLSQEFFGSRHMLFGTDFPWGNTERIIENIRGLEIPDDEKRMILGENAVKLLKVA
jgi:predicted TIM-barrel fold metal-dependent hydrolase